jgi:xanthine dehydrogenase small subunit
MPTKIHFLLNDRAVCTSEPGGLLVLDYLRKKEHLAGTKEGCKEGDCGACVVLIGDLEGEKVHYRPVTSCLTPLGELQGKHLVTIEGLNLADDLSPVQQAIVAEGGSQCGFCTPGIVVSLTGFLMQEGWDVSPAGIKKALSGHLCRCTGYASLKRAGKILQNTIAKDLVQTKSRIETLIALGALPAYFRDIPARLRALPAMHTEEAALPSEFMVAGGTDIYVQKGEALPEARVKILNLYPEIRGITRQNGHIRIGALTTFEEIAHHPQILEIMPEMPQYLHLIASWQVCNRATLGGNIINASPIGDMTAIFLALEAELVLCEGIKSRSVAIKEFYKGYKKLDKTPGEILTEVVVPVRDRETKFNFEKVSKRKCLDIASVTSAVRVKLDKGAIGDIALTMGGVAPIPLFMRNTCAYLLGKPVSKDTVKGAMPVAQSEISPISDIRGSSDYKRLLVRQFLIAHLCKLFPESVKARDLI